MLVTLPSVGITLVLHPTIKVLLAVSIKQFPPLWYTSFPSSTVMLVRPEQPKGTILVTLLGIVMLVRPEQPLKASPPMLVPPVITTVLRELGTLLLLI